MSKEGVLVHSFSFTHIKVDGHGTILAALPGDLLPRVAQVIKLASKMDIAGSDNQEGSFSFLFNGRPVDTRVALLWDKVTFPSFVIRFFDKAQGVRHISKLMLDADEIDTLADAYSRKQGVLYVTGPTGSGKTTTLYAVLNTLNTEDTFIETIEDPIEYQIEGITQNQTKKDAVGYEYGSFADILRRILRRAPNIILVGETRDVETAVTTLNAANTGHLCMSTLHCNDAIECFTRLEGLKVDPYLINSAVVLAQAQRLVRVLCRCKIDVEINDKIRAFYANYNVEIPQEITHIYRPAGCNLCRHTGYKGRVSVMEMVRPSVDFREALLEKAPLHTLKEIAAKNGYVTMFQRGLRRVVSGMTSMQEVVTNLRSSSEILQSIAD